MPAPASAGSLWVVGHKAQQEWGRGRRKNFLIVLAFYFGGLGAGIFISSLLANYPLGALVGLVIVGVGKIAAHILFLGRPSRFWRSLLRPNSSWISRGIISVLAFLVFGLGYLIAESQKADPGLAEILYGLAIAGAAATILYSGLLLNRTAIPFWQHNLLPVIFFVISIGSGASSTAFINEVIPSRTANYSLLQDLSIWGILLTLSLLAIYLWGAHTGSVVGKTSVRYLVHDSRWYFYGMFLGLGLLLPLVVFLLEYYAGFDLPKWMVLAAKLVEPTIGALLFRFTIFHAGFFRPIRIL